SKQDRVRYTAMTLMGLGMVFFGLELMKDGFSIIKDLPAFEAWFETFDATSYLGVLKCAAVGCILTFIIQSSSATLGITMGLASIGVIPLETAAALVLGENVGTTITAFLASLTTTVNAKRAAYFHVIFNVLGVLWVTAIFVPIYLPLIKWIAGMVVGTVPGAGPSGVVLKDVTFAIALTHTVFNVANTILFLPFVRTMASLLERIIPARAGKEKPHLTSLDIRLLQTAVIAIEQSRVEVLRMGFGCKELAAWLKEIISQEVPDRKLAQQAFHREEELDTVQDEIVAFIAHLLTGNVPLEVEADALHQLRMADEYESISDYLISILKSHLKLEESGLHFSDADSEDLLRLHEMVADYLQMVNEGYEKRRPAVLVEARAQGGAITAHVKELREKFLARMSDEKLEPQVVVAYTSQLNSYRRVRAHALNVAEAMAGEK
ncbi:MAG: sodium:phosphate symporter, partial [Planctomycetes bacterium RBG_13_63_9]